MAEQQAAARKDEAKRLKQAEKEQAKAAKAQAEQQEKQAKDQKKKDKKSKKQPGEPVQAPKEVGTLREREFFPVPAAEPVDHPENTPKTEDPGKKPDPEL